MKKLGVIGGLGPMATAYFMELIVEMSEAKTDQEHIEVLVHSKPSIPDRTSYIIGKSDKNPLPDLLEVEQTLVEQGAEIIAIPCITAHFFQPELETLGVPVIHAIEETAKYLKEAGITCAGVMATDGTIQSRLFQDTFRSFGIDCVVPEEAEQEKVMHLIYQDVKAGKEPELPLFLSVKGNLYEQGAQVILLGCTELSMIKRNLETGPDVLDVMEVLAKTAVERCGHLKASYQKLITEKETKYAESRIRLLG